MRVHSQVPGAPVVLGGIYMVRTCVYTKRDWAATDYAHWCHVPYNARARQMESGAIVKTKLAPTLNLSTPLEVHVLYYAISSQPFISERKVLEP